jgi:hypothetical protein
MNFGNILSYLDMQIMLDQGVVTVDVSYYLEKLFEGYNNLPLCIMLEKKTLFAVNDTVEPLVEAEQKVFHTAVPRLLYLPGQIL